MSLTGTLLKLTENLTPMTTLTELSRQIADRPLGALTQRLIKSFIKSFNINMEEIANPDLSSYKTFNEFFIRSLKEGARPISTDCLAVSPTDGTVGQAEEIRAGRLIQAKGLDYSLRDLLGGNAGDCAPFEGGHFACIYLSPSNYHRIHMPVDGTLVRTVHVPGRHYPVGMRNIHHMEGLYTKNERLVCFFETEHGPFALVMVGACLVGSIGTVWGGTVRRHPKATTDLFEAGAYHYKPGDEIGHFKYGSTVICLWGWQEGQLAPAFTEGTPVKMGQAMIV